MIFKIWLDYGRINQIDEYDQSLSRTRMSGLGRHRAYGADQGLESSDSGKTPRLFRSLHESLWRWNLGGNRFPADLCENQEFLGAAAGPALCPAGNALRDFPASRPPPGGEVTRVRPVDCLVPCRRKPAWNGGWIRIISIGWNEKLRVGFKS